MNKNITSVAGFMSEGLVRIPYPTELRGAVEKAISSWKIFCRLPESVRLKFPYNSGTGMGVGYELKKAPGANLDLKEDFHVTLGSERWLLDAADTTGEKDVAEFVGNAEELIRVIEPFIANFAKQIEETFSLAKFSDDVAANKNEYFLRFLHYFGNRTAGDEIATPHADKSGFTLHLYESDPGLQYLDFKKEWKEMPVDGNETVIIPGMRLQYRSENKLKALYHRVIATPKTAQQGRFSIVCFVHPKNTLEYNKQKSGRLQEFQPGFNYEMPFAEFSKLFI